MRRTACRRLALAAPALAVRTLAAPALVTAALALVQAPAAAAEPPPCAYGEVLLAGDPWRDHADLPLDTTYRLPATPDPPDLLSVREAGFTGDHRVRAPLIDDLRALGAAAEAAGAALEIQSAYRSYAYQAAVHQVWVERLGEARARRVSARPGHSEHQLGTAIDFRSRGGPAPWDAGDWAATAAGSWLFENAHRYGFLLSYPDGEEERTCYDYEPWHYRWVGRERAAEVHAAGVPLRVWLWRRGPPEVQP